MENIAVPKCGESDRRNVEYVDLYSPEVFFKTLVKTDHPLIIDVGAHQGESVTFFKSLFERCEIFSYEPCPENFSKLLDVTEAYGTVAVNAAVGPEVGEVPFYQQSSSHLGGLLPINGNSSDSLGYASTASNCEKIVQCVSLDSEVDALELHEIDILKIDVQGYEVGVLKGAKSALKYTNVVMIEISLYDFYGDDGSSWFEANKILGTAGFTLYDISKVSKNPKNFRTDWAELVFCKTGVS